MIIRYYFWAIRMLQRVLPAEERALIEEVERIGTEEAANMTKDEYFRRLDFERRVNKE